MSEWIVEALSLPPVAVDDDTDDAKLAENFEERLEALLASLQLEPTAEGWRSLALQLALRHEPAFAIETPVDRTGRSGIGGRPVGFSGFIARSMMKQAMREGASQKGAAENVAKRLSATMDKAPSARSLENMMSRPSPTPDTLKRSRYEFKAFRALEMAAEAASRKG